MCSQISAALKFTITAEALCGELVRQRKITEKLIHVALPHDLQDVGVKVSFHCMGLVGVEELATCIDDVMSKSLQRCI